MPATKPGTPYNLPKHLTANPKSHETVHPPPPSSGRTAVAPVVPAFPDGADVAGHRGPVGKQRHHPFRRGIRGNRQHPRPPGLAPRGHQHGRLRQPETAILPLRQPNRQPARLPHPPRRIQPPQRASPRHGHRARRPRQHPPVHPNRRLLAGTGAVPANPP